MAKHDYVKKFSTIKVRRLSRYDRPTQSNKNVGKAIDNLLESIQILPQQLIQIAERGKEVAQQKLIKASDDTLFTQKYQNYGYSLLADNLKVVDYTTDNGDFNAVVTITPTNYKMYWNFVFAEYGAGMLADKTAKQLGYKPIKQKKEANSRIVTPYEFKANMLLRNDPNKNNPDYRQWYFEDLQGKGHITNKSSAVRYMQSASENVRMNVEHLIHWKKVSKKRQADWKLKY